MPVEKSDEKFLKMLENFSKEETGFSAEKYSSDESHDEMIEERLIRSGLPLEKYSKQKK